MLSRHRSRKCVSVLLGFNYKRTVCFKAIAISPHVLLWYDLLSFIIICFLLLLGFKQGQFVLKL